MSAQLYWLAKMPIKQILIARTTTPISHTKR
jgi:hypothetical protein